MSKYDQFYDFVKGAALKFKEWDPNETIRVISHLDADGISSVSLIIQLLNIENRKFSISVVQQLSKKNILEFAKEPYKNFIITDLGSGQIDLLKEILHDRNIIVLDHHKVLDVKADNVLHVNPHLFGIDGSKEVSGAGVVFWFGHFVNLKMDDYSYIAIIGAIGDIQEQNGFLPINKDILDIAIKHGKIKLIKGLRIFGAQTRALHKTLEYSTDPYIPGVSGSESGAIQFLQNLGITLKDGKVWRKLVDLSPSEIQHLVAGIIMQRSGEEDPSDVLGNVYILREEVKESPLRDVKEFSTLLNACGRMNNASLGIGACIGDQKAKKKAIASLGNYRKEIVKAMNWYESNKNTSMVVSGKGYLIINAQDNIMPSIIGTMSSIVSKSKNVSNNCYICSLARQVDNTTKVSMRFSGRRKDIDLRKVVGEIVDRVGGEAGGHDYAAGAVISTDLESNFLEVANEILSKKGMEEIVN